MDAKDSKNNSSPSTPSSSSTVDSLLDPIIPNSTEFSIITLLPCEYDPIDGFDSQSEESIDSSDIPDSSDDESQAVKINEIYKTNEQTIKTK